MGLLRARSLLLVAGAALLVDCKSADEVAACAAVCEKLEICGLLPSPLGRGSDPETLQQNCRERCELTHGSGDAVGHVLACYRDAEESGEGPWQPCQRGSKCEPLAQCLDARFPAGTPTGVGRVVVRVVFEGQEDACPSETSQTSDALCVEPEPTPPISAPGGCDQISQLRLLPPTGTLMSMTGLTELCPDAVASGFPVFQMEAGLYTPKVKVIGQRPVSSGHAAGAGGTDAEVTEPYCRIVASPTAFRIQAGETNLVTVSIPTNVAEQERCAQCESDCLAGGDDDKDGQANCADLVCSSRCEQCEISLDEAGQPRPNCLDPGCAAFCAPSPPSGAGGTPASGEDTDVGGSGAAQGGAADEGSAGAGAGGSGGS